MNARELVAAYFERMNAEDWEGLGQLFHQEAELEAPGFGASAAASRYRPTFARRSASIPSITTIRCAW